MLDLPKGFVSRLAANDFLFLRDATSAGAGIGVLPAYVAAPLVANGSLVQVLATARVHLPGLVILYPSTGPLARKVTAFRDFIVGELKKVQFE